MIRRRYFWTILAAVPLLLAADGPHLFKAKDPKHPKLAIVTNNTADFWKLCRAGVRRFEKEADVTIDFKMPAMGTAKQQKAIIDEVIDDGSDGIAVAVVDPNRQAGDLTVIADGKNLICFDSDCPECGRALYIGVDNVEAGRKLGERLVELLPHGGKVAVLCGHFAAENASQRLAGIEKAIDGHKIEIVAKPEDQTDRMKARANAEEWIGKADLLVGLWSYEGPAIAAAAADAGVKGKGVVFDEEEGTLDGIKSGFIDSTFVQRADEMGYQTAKWLYELAIKGPDAKLPEGRVVKPDVKKVDAKNLEAFRDELKKLKGDE